MEPKTESIPGSPATRRWPAWLTRESVISSGRTMLWVAPLTALVWVYAEREQIIYPTYPNVNDVPVQITTSSPRNWFVEQTGQTQKVNLKLTGPQAAIEQVRDELTNRIPRGLSIDLGDSLNPGQQRINVKERIENRPEFKLAGVSVEDVQPAELTFNVEEVVQTSVEVQLPPLATPLVNPPVITPARVQIRGPRSVIDKIKRIDANPTGLVDGLKPGDHELGLVPLSIPAGLQVTPAKVDVKLVVGDASVKLPYRGMLIWVCPPPGLDAEYEVVLDDKILNETLLEGPKSGIDQVDKPFLPHAILEVSRDDAVQPTPKTLIFVLPEGVHESAADHNRKFDRYHLVKRNNAPG